MLRKLTIASTFCMLMLSLSACQTTGSGSGVSRATSLEKAAVQRWQHLIASEFAQAWEYFTPGYKAVRTAENYAREMEDRPVKWKSVEFVNADCESEQRCIVNMRIGYSLHMPVTGVGEVRSEQVLRETWVNTGNGWGFLPDDLTR